MYNGYRTERRRFQRLRVNLSVLYHIEGPEHVREILADREFEGNTLDLSEGGMALLAWHYLPVDTELLLKIVIFESDHRGLVSFYDAVKLTGHVRSVIPAENDEYRLGICFDNVSVKKRQILSDLIYSPLKASVNIMRQESDRPLSFEMHLE